MFRCDVMQGRLNALWRGRSLISFEVDNTGIDFYNIELHTRYSPWESTLILRLNQPEHEGLACALSKM
jgi:hypothetical protein